LNRALRCRDIVAPREHLKEDKMLKHLTMAAMLSAPIVFGEGRAYGCDLIICDDTDCEICEWKSETDEFFNCVVVGKFSAELWCGVDLVEPAPQLIAPQLPQVMELIRPDVRVVTPQTVVRPAPRR
jgi:hypothetical protein